MPGRTVSIWDWSQEIMIRKGLGGLEVWLCLSCAGLRLKLTQELEGLMDLPFPSAPEKEG